MLDINKILIPVDFSSRSRRAIEHGINIAKHFNAGVVFLHVIPDLPYDSAFLTEYGAAGAFWTPTPDHLAAIRKKLHALVEQVAPGHPGDRVVVNGPPAVLIEDTIKQLDVDLVVMPTAGAGPFRRFLLGSVTTKVLNDSECPVFTGAHVDDIETFSLRPYRRIGCAIDLEEQSSRVLRFANDFAAAYRAELEVVHAIPAISEDGGGTRAAPQLGRVLEDHIRTRTAAMLDEINADAQVLVDIGEPENVVARAAEEQNLDLLVIGRRRDDGLFAGLRSHAFGMIRRAPCPVLSV